MKEINEEIKLTLNLMQTDIDEGAHSELQCHLSCLLEIKRNEFQQRLVERSWFEPADGIGSVVSFDQAPYKSVKLDGQIADDAKLLTVDELIAGVWWCADTSEECRLAFVSMGVSVAMRSWENSPAIVNYAYKLFDSRDVILAFLAIDLRNLKQIHRIGNEFYWGEK